MQIFISDGGWKSYTFIPTVVFKLLWLFYIVNKRKQRSASMLAKFVMQKIQYRIILETVGCEIQKPCLSLGNCKCF